MKTSFLFSLLFLWNIALFAQNSTLKNSVSSEEEFPLLSPENIYHSVVFDKPEQNFNLLNLNSAGDLDGDGYDDAYFFAGFCADERTSDLYDRVNKSYVVFGGSDLNSLKTLMFYSKIVPIGDINGDGKDDLYEANTDINFRILYGNSQESFINGSVIYNPSLWGYTSFPSEINGFSDFNGDGFGDIAFALSSTNTTILYGALSEDDIRAEQYTINYNKGTSKNKVKTGKFNAAYTQILSICVEEGDITNTDLNDNQHIVFELFDLSSDNVSNTTYTFETSLAYYLSITYAERGMENLGAMDITGDGINEWVFGFNYNQISYLKTNDGIVELGGDLITLDVFKISTFKNIGDLNGDNREDFMWDISFSLDNKSIGLTNEIQTVNLRAIIDDKANGVGDFNGDGLDDLSVLIDNSIEKGYKLLYAGNTSSLTRTNLFLESEFSYSEKITMTQNVGDFNGDGTDDFVYYNDDYLWLYLDGPESTPIIKKLTTGENEYLEKIVSADFNGDGFRDIITSICDISNPSLYNHILSFHMGSSNPDLEPESIVNSTLWIPIGQLSSNLSLNPIGDLNKDGKDDLIISEPYNNNSFQIIHGSENPESAQLISCSLPISTIYCAAGRSVGVGDFNNDGIDDFALGCLTLDKAVYGNKREGVHVYFGEGINETENSYNTPDLILNEEYTNAYADSFGMNITSGDYNGDGKKDIAVIPYRTYLTSGGYDPEGYNTLFIYYGGEYMDNMADIQLKIPHRLFGDDIEGTLNKFSSELNTVADINQDNCDELFLGNKFIYNSSYPESTQKYAAILFGGSSLETGDLKGINLKGYDIIGSIKNTYYYSDFKSAIGDFDGDGNIELLARCDDGNYKGTSIYEYQLKSTSTRFNSLDPSQKIKIHPNPAKSHITINIDDSMGSALVEIYSIQGKRVLSKEIQTAVPFSIAHLNRGVYILKVIQNNQVFSDKLIVLD